MYVLKSAFVALNQTQVVDKKAELWCESYISYAHYPSLLQCCVKITKIIK